MQFQRNNERNSRPLDRENKVLAIMQCAWQFSLRGYQYIQTGQLRWTRVTNCINLFM